jgi:tripartite ATP-independent transporter DctM subunit
MDSSLLVFISMTLGLIVGIMSGYYLFAAMGTVGIFFGLVFWGPDVLNQLYFSAFNTMKDYTLLAIPLFVFMGSMLDKSGVAEKLFDVLSIALGRVKGGLAIAAMLIAILFAATTGIIGASVVAMGLIFLPAMLSRNYEKSFASGLICAGGSLGILIPPSIMLVILASTANVSVGQMLYAALIPGVVLGLSYIVYIVIRANLQPHLAPPLPDIELNKYSRAEVVKGVFLHVLPVFIIILAVLGTIWVGIAPPTEAAAIGAFASILIALVYRRLNLRVLNEAARETVLTSAMVYFIIIFANLFVSVFMRLGGSKVVANAFASLPFGRWGVFAIMMFVVFLLGFIMDWIAASLIIIPVFVPIIKTLGFDVIWFLTMVAIMFQTAFLTPPVATAIFYLKGIAPPEVSTSDIIKGIWPYVVIVFLVVILCSVFPEIVMWLPGKLLSM